MISGSLWADVMAGNEVLRDVGWRVAAIHWGWKGVRNQGVLA